MPMLPVQLPPGVVRGATPYETPGRWWDTNLVRWRGGVLEPVGGWQRSSAQPMSGAVRNIFVWRDNLNFERMLLGQDDKLVAQADGVFTDVSPTSFVPLTATGAYGFGVNDYNEEDYGDARATPSVALSDNVGMWTMDNWGEDVLAVASTDGRLLHYSVASPTTDATVVSGAPIDNRAVLVTPERHVQMIGVGNNPRRFGWSSREDYEDWDFTSTTNTAGYLDLDATTPLRAMVKVRDGTLVLSESECYLSRYVGLPFIYNAERIGEVRLMSPFSYATFEGRCVILGQTGFKLYDGGSIQHLECPLIDYILADMDPEAGKIRTYGAWNGVFPELWFWYPSVGQNECDKYVIYNYAEGWWAIGSLSRTAMTPAAARQYPFMAGVDNYLYQHEFGWTNAGASRVGSVYAETGALGIGQGDRTIEVRQLLPGNGAGFGSMQFRFYGQQTPEGSERNFGPYTVRSNGYADTRVNGREVRMRVEATQDTDWSIGKIRLDVAAGTGR